MGKGTGERGEGTGMFGELWKGIEAWCHWERMGNCGFVEGDEWGGTPLRLQCGKVTVYMWDKGMGAAGMDMGCNRGGVREWGQGDGGGSGKGGV